MKLTYVKDALIAPSCNLSQAAEDVQYLEAGGFQIPKSHSLKLARLKSQLPKLNSSVLKSHGGDIPQKPQKPILTANFTCFAVVKIHCPWDFSVIQSAIFHGQFHVLQWLASMLLSFLYRLLSDTFNSCLRIVK